ncbi:hypothetical protein V8D89_007068 [Ganoderma adspersum]
MSDHVEPTSPHLDRLDTLHIPPPTYMPWNRNQDIGGLYQYPPSGMPAPALRGGVTGRDEASLPVAISLPLACCAALGLNIPAYYLNDSVGSLAWDTRAIEYGIGAGCVGAAASILLLVDRHYVVDTLLEWKRTVEPRNVELGFLLAYTVALFPCVPRLGYDIRSLSAEGSWKAFVVPTQVFLVAVPTLFVVVAVLRLLRPKAVEIEGWYVV